MITGSSRRDRVLLGLAAALVHLPIAERPAPRFAALGTR